MKDEIEKKLKNRLKKPKSATIKKIWDSILNQLNFERLNLERKNDLSQSGLIYQTQVKRTW